MKVVLFCGGLGMRIREYSESVPKPMVPIGHQPILWHVMQYYIHHGHRDFILCLGYKANVIRNYFRDLDPSAYSDCVISEYGKKVEVLGPAPPDWKITRWCELRGTYSYLNMSLRDNPGYTDVGNLLGSYIGSSPHNVASFQSLFNLPNHFELDATYRYSGSLPEYSVDSYSTADLRLGYHFGEGVEFSVIGQNLLTLTKLKFIDPETYEFGNNLNLNAASNSARAYPLPIFYGVGLNMTF